MSDVYVIGHIPEDKQEELKKILSNWDARVEKIDLNTIKKDPWPKQGDQYFFIDYANNIVCVYYRETDCDKANKEIGNVFRTKAEAQKALDKLKLQAKLKSLSDDDQPWNNYNEHWFIDIYYKYSDNVFKIELDSNTVYRSDRIYFKSEESARKAMDLCRDEIIRLYMPEE